MNSVANQAGIADTYSKLVRAANCKTVEIVIDTNHTKIHAIREALHINTTWFW